jgi:RNA polymerase sigma-70 factor (ECF subfamily)
MAEDETQTLILLRRWHSGEEAALGELLRRDLPWIRSHVKKRLGPKLRERAETMDVVQEAMVRVLKDGPRFLVSDSHKFRSLVAAIIENVLRGQNRDQRQQRRDVAREEDMPSSGVLDLDATSPSQAAMRNEDIAWMELSMELLAPSDRDVILMRQWEGLPFAEVGERLGVSEEAASRRFHRALGRLAPLMKRLRTGELSDVLDKRTRCSDETS